MLQSETGFQGPHAFFQPASTTKMAFDVVLQQSELLEPLPKVIPIRSTMRPMNMAQAFFGKHEIKRSVERVNLYFVSEENKWYALNIKSGNLNVAHGRYAFVTHLPENAPSHGAMLSNIVAWPVQAAAHNDTFHLGLSEFEEYVAYAGEVTFDIGTCKFWNNASGKYQPPAKQKSAAQLPEDSFVLPNFSY